MRHYGTDRLKLEAREATVIRAWAALTGSQLVPRGRSYWTMCGPMAAEDGRLQPMCELLHALKRVLSHPSQFTGVELSPSVHKRNFSAVAGDPRFRKDRPSLLNGAIQDELGKAVSASGKAPAIVNLDTEFEPKAAAALLGSVLEVLDGLPGPTMVVMNVVLDQPHRGRRYRAGDMTGVILRNTSCSGIFAGRNCPWVESEAPYVYPGTGCHAVKMATTHFFRK